MNSRFEYLTLLNREVRDEIIVCNSGGTQYELFNINDRKANFYAPGVGVVCQVALGMSLAIPERKVIALDGDGSLLLNLGILPVLGHERPANLLIIVFDNGFYEAGGNKRSLAGFETRLEDMAKGAGVDTVSVISDLGEFETAIRTALTVPGFRFLVVKTEPGRVGGNPKTTSGMEIKFRFARYVEESLGRSIFQPPTQSFKSATSSSKEKA